jgi:hypothetical protein
MIKAGAKEKENWLKEQKIKIYFLQKHNTKEKNY